MRVIIKPLGLIAFLIGVTVLVVLAFFATKPPEASSASATPSPTIVAPEWQFAQTDTGAGKMERIDASNAPSFIHAMRVTVTKENTSQAWAVQMNRVIPVALPEGRNLALRFWARSATKGKALVVVEEVKEPFTHELTLDQPLTPEWQRYIAPFKTTHAYKENALHIGLQVGREKGTYEFGPVELIDPDTALPIAP